MAGALIEFEVVDHDARTMVEKLRAKLDRPEPVFLDIGEALTISFRDRFGRGVDAEGHPWAPLSQVTLDRKRKNKDKILVLDGYLRRLAYQADNTGVRIGTDRIYGALHQFGARKGEFGRTRRGAPIPWGDVPAREYLGLSDTDEGDILDILHEWLAS